MPQAVKETRQAANAKLKGQSWPIPHRRPESQAVRAEVAITGQGEVYANKLFMLLRLDGARIVQFRYFAAKTC